MRPSTRSLCLSLLLGAGLCGAAAAQVPAAPAAPAAQAVETPDLALASAAFVYGYPLNEVMRACDRAPAVNALRRATTLATAASRGVVAPNNDTLYTSACLYLGAGWVRVGLPPAQGRYQSLQVVDAYSNNVAVLGPREVPAAGAQYVLRLAGAHAEGLPAGVPVIEVPTPYAFFLVRTLVKGTHDLEAAIAAQEGITLAPQAAAAPPRQAPVGPTPASDFFLKLMFRLHQNPPPASERALVASMAAIGVKPAAAPTLDGVDAALRAVWEQAHGAGLASLASALSTQSRRQGLWTTAANTGVFGNDYAFRARMARVGLLALPPSEAVYFSARSSARGQPLDGRTGHTLILPAGSWPPLTAPGFWSLSMYGADNYFVDNPIQRFAINGFTPGLKPQADGSLKIHLQCTDPGGEASANWLPAPCGPFWVSLRLYLPAAAVLEPGYAMPVLE